MERDSQGRYIVGSGCKCSVSVYNKSTTRMFLANTSTISKESQLRITDGVWILLKPQKEKKR